MLHDDRQTSGPGCVDRLDGPCDEPEKQQYTIKGIETDALELMRGAARKEGMKIGAWISARMKEAAFKSLRSTARFPSHEGQSLFIQDPNLVDGPAEGIEAASLHDLDQRLRRIESELHQITKAQRTIMTRMLEGV